MQKHGIFDRATPRMSASMNLFVLRLRRLSPLFGVDGSDHPGGGDDRHTDKRQCVGNVFKEEDADELGERNRRKSEARNQKHIAADPSSCAGQHSGRSKKAH